MTRIARIIELMKISWGIPSRPVHRGEVLPNPLACSFDPVPSPYIGRVPFEVPEEMREFWSVARSAVLFKDVVQGQWGLKILDPLEALEETKYLKSWPQFSKHDLVIGLFLGDEELLVLRCDLKSSVFGSVVVALPLDSRSDWPTAAANFEQFLERYEEKAGDKYWEKPNFGAA